MPSTHHILIADSNEQFPCNANQTVLRAMESLGKRGVPVGCRGGGCGVCKVRILSGTYTTQKMSRGCLSESEEAAGTVLACRVQPHSDLVITVVGKMAKAWTNS